MSRRYGSDYAEKVITPQRYHHSGKQYTLSIILRYKELLEERNKATQKFCKPPTGQEEKKE